MKKLFVISVTLLVVVALGWYMFSPTTYDFGNGAQLMVPWGTISADKRNEGYGVAVQAGVNVTVHNDSDEWRTLTVSFKKPNYGMLDTHAFEDLPPRSSKTFGADSDRYEAMYVSVSNYAQKERDKTKI